MVGIVVVAFITVALVAAAFGVAVANAVRTKSCQEGDTVGPSDAHGYFDCAENKLVCDTGYHAQDNKCQPGGPPPPPGHDDIPAPLPATAAQVPMLSAYTNGLYPAGTPDYAKKGGANLWRTLDLFYTGSCIAGTLAVTTGSNKGTMLATPASGPNWRVPAEPNSLPALRPVLQAYLKAVTFTPGASARFKIKVASDTSTEAACISWSVAVPTDTYYPARYEPVELPLAEAWQNQTGSFLAALSINRYSPAFDPNRMSDQGDVGYCVTGAGVTEKKQLSSVSGVSTYLLRDGFKSGAWTEVSHVDTHYAKGEGATKLPYFSYEDGLADKCVNASKSHGALGGTGSGHYHYVTRGSGIWLNMGITEVVQNKVDALRHVLNNWDGRNKTFDASTKKFTLGPVAFQNPSMGKLGDTTSLATWLRYVKAATGAFMAAAMSQSCSDPTFLKSIGNDDGTDQTLAPQAPITDVLSLSSQAFYRAPCLKSGSTSYCQLPGLYFSNIPAGLGPTAGGLLCWGAFAPLAPKSLFASPGGKVPTVAADALAERQRLLSWVLWACVNGYDFAKNAELHTPPVAALFKGKTPTQQNIQNQRLNAFLANFSNTPYNQDDVIAQYCYNKGLDTFQLVRSATNNLAYSFELFAFTGSVDQSKASPKTWNCTTPGNDPIYFTRNPLSASDAGVRMKAIVDGGSCTTYSDCPGEANCTGNKCQSRYLNANPTASVSYNIGHPISYPYYRQASGDFTVPKCSDLKSPCSGPPSPPSPPGSLTVGAACTSTSHCPSGSSCQSGFCAYTRSKPCPDGACAVCGPAKGTLAADCPVKAGYPAGCYSSLSSKCVSAGKAGNTCDTDCQCYLCGCVQDSQCPSGKTCNKTSGQCQ